MSQLKIYSHFVQQHESGAASHRPDAQDRRRPGHSRHRVDRDHHEGLAASRLGLEYQRAFTALVHGAQRMAALDAFDRFGLEEYAKTLKSTLFMDEFLRKQEAVMDKYDPEKKVALVVDEWGAWHAPLPGSNPAFLVQQNSLRDAILASLNLNIFARHADRVRMANIAQMINVLQAMILTDKEKMVLTPTYYVYKMYVPFQDATFVPVAFDAGTYTQGSVTLPRVDAIAARDAVGKLWLEITNLDPEKPLTIDADDHRHGGEVGEGRDADRACRGQREHIRQRPTRSCRSR